MRVRTLAASPDADLISVCEEMLALKAEFNALFDQRHTIEDEERTEPELMILYDRETEIQDRLCDQAAPSTLEGAQALARLAVARWSFAIDGGLVAEDFDQWVNLSVVEYLAAAEV